MIGVSFGFELIFRIHIHTQTTHTHTNTHNVWYILFKSVIFTKHMTEFWLPKMKQNLRGKCPFPV